MQADVRFLAASNVPLDRLAAEGKFRQDLYYRLTVVTVHLPPLRERREDILLLAAHFIEKHTPANRAPARLTADAGQALLASDWPGNVRQLESAVRRAVLLGDGVTIRPQDLGVALPPEDVTAAQPVATSYRVQKRLLIEGFERQYLTELLTRYHGNLSRAAGASGRDRHDLRRLLKRHKLDRAAFQTKG